MFTKLLKYEFCTVGKTLGLLSIAVLFAGMLGFIFSLFINTNDFMNNNPILVILIAPIIILIALTTIGYAFSSVIIIYKQFYTSKFTDQGYLTFTLPVTTHQILLSSILNAVIWGAITITVLFISIILMIAPSIATQLPVKFFNFNSDINLGLGILQILNSLCSIAYALILPFLSITLGSLWAKKRKLGAAFCIGYGINMFVSFLTSLLQILEYTIDSSVSIVYSILRIVLMLLLSVGGYFLMHHLIDKKLNI